MSAKRSVTTKNKKLYSISESRGEFWVYRVKVGFIMDDKHNIGTTKSLEDALALIKVDSGSDIKKIS